MLRYCVAWRGIVSEREARNSVPGASVSIFPADGSAMIAYGPVASVSDLLFVLNEKLRGGGSWEWRDENDKLLDRASLIPSREDIVSMPSVSTFLKQL